jgi:3-hydroxy-9,10-secoandrosta-1,3,5(10)-triene-9,17-dione monooxygenase reductase component
VRSNRRAVIVTLGTSPCEFRDALAHFASGVTVITAQSENGPVGVTASAFTSVSLEPPLVLVCLARSASAQRSVLAADAFGVSVLAEPQAWIADSFARKGVDRFQGVPLRPIPHSDLPLLEGALVHLECKRYATHEAGDHYIVVGEVRHSAMAREPAARPLVHYHRRFGTFTSG